MGKPWMLLAVGALAFLAAISAIESPEYEVVHVESEFEVRLYRESVWMSATVNNINSFHLATKLGFHRLFQYIEGANLNWTYIPMTKPILTSVTPESNSPLFNVHFFLPSNIGDKPPVPLDELNLQTVTFPSHCVAVRKFSGFTRDSNIARVNNSSSRNPKQNSINSTRSCTPHNSSPKKNMALMKTNKTLLIFILPILTTSILMSSSEAYSVNHPSHHTKSVKGVYWFQGSIDVSAIDSSLFTHIFCAFANLDSDTFNVTIGASDAPVFSTFTSTLQRRNPHISTLLSIGGGGSNATAFAAMTASPAARKAFIDSSIYVARSNNFHGLDLDYEFPVTTADMNNLAVLLSEWRSAVNAESQSSQKPCLLLTSAVYYTAVYHSVQLPAKAMGRYLDWINLMAYDFFAPAWSTLTRPAAALNDPTSAITGANGANAWLNAGVPAKKVVLGVPYYGRAYELSNAADHTYLAAFKGALPGTDNGAMTYRQIKAFIANNTAAITTVYNATTAESYSYVGTTWITYDGVEAISDKMKFVKEKGLLGYFAWQVGGDDEKFTLSRTAGRVLR